MPPPSGRTSTGCRSARTQCRASCDCAWAGIRRSTRFGERNVLFDETLDVLPLHWSGEPFSYRGRHFSARDVVALPRPVQDPIPVCIGGNSLLSRRRAAERGQGWMPMSGGADLAATTRTPPLGQVWDLAAVISDMRDANGMARFSQDPLES